MHSRFKIFITTLGKEKLQDECVRQYARRDDTIHIQDASTVGFEKCNNGLQELVSNWNRTKIVDRFKNNYQLSQRENAQRNN